MKCWPVVIFLEILGILTLVGDISQHGYDVTFGICHDHQAYLVSLSGTIVAFVLMRRTRS